MDSPLRTDWPSSSADRDSHSVLRGLWRRQKEVPEGARGKAMTSGPRATGSFPDIGYCPTTAPCKHCRQDWNGSRLLRLSSQCMCDSNKRECSPLSHAANRGMNVHSARDSQNLVSLVALHQRFRGKNLTPTKRRADLPSKFLHCGPRLFAFHQITQVPEARLWSLPLSELECQRQS